jgi:hypothetical protein
VAAAAAAFCFCHSHCRSYGPRGKGTPVFLAQILEACEQSGVASGWVSGTQRGKRTVLVFSRNIPAGCQQRIRNAWVVGG